MLYRGDDARRLARLMAIADDASVPLIAVNDVLYHAPERRPLQDVVTCIREHVTIETAGRRLEANAERHLKSPQEMARLFRKAPEAIEETQNFPEPLQLLARGAAQDRISGRNPARLRHAAGCAGRAGEGRRRSAAIPNGIQKENVRDALDKELAITAELKYAPYFLTVHDIVRFARSKGILCQGRGSAANSVICYCLGITEVDPEKVDLLFERFVSAERREPPDIDVDFEHERREEVIQYIYNAMAASAPASPPPSSAIAAAAPSARSARSSACPTTPSARSPARCGAGRWPASRRRKRGAPGSIRPIRGSDRSWRWRRS